MTSNRRAKRKRQDRAQRAMEQAIEESLGKGPSEGVWAVMDKDTKELTRGLNYNRAEALWKQHGNAIILNDQHVRGPGPRYADWD